MCTWAVWENMINKEEHSAELTVPCDCKEWEKVEDEDVLKKRTKSNKENRLFTPAVQAVSVLPYLRYCRS